MKKPVLLFMLLLLVSALWAQNRYALVIGNAVYESPDIKNLPNTINDAEDISAALRGLGYQVELKRNLKLTEMIKAVDDFTVKLKADRSNNEGFVWFAGHGVLIDNQNYLLPVDVNIQTDNLAKRTSYPFSDLLDELNKAKNKANVLVVDACRSPPETAEAAQATRDAYGSATRVIQRVANVPEDLFIMYSTASGQPALEGEGQRNSPFAKAFLTHINSTEPLQLMASHILNETLSLTGRRQRPDWQGSVSDAYYSLNKTGSGQVVGAIRVTSEIAGEILIDGQPTGTTIKADGTEIIANRKTGATEVAVKEPNGTVTKAPTVRVLQGQTVAAVIERPVPANMVRINGGTFTMGSPASEVDRRDNEGPQHRVTVSSFYMGKYEVTQKEYQEVMGTNPSYFKGDNLPVEQVSWFDAVNYCNRLSQKEGLTPAYTINGENITWNQNANGYRLPTEAEWEYACRAETTTRFWSGNDETSLAGKANVADLTAKEKYTDWTIVNIRDGYAETSPVGRFSPNSWGLYDMHGNVWEWCWDWYGDYPSNAQTDPRGASSGSNRVFRGGSWSNYAQILRSAYRDYYTPSSRYYFIGFRVVRP